MTSGGKVPVKWTAPEVCSVLLHSNIAACVRLNTAAMHSVLQLAFTCS